MEDNLRTRVIGQDEALDGGVERGATRPGRAAGSEPTHRLVPLPRAHRRVGKTETARTLADFLFDDEQAMVRHRHERVHGEALRLHG